MPFAATFGSVGDFIAICQVAAKLGKALGNGYCGSSTEYQDLRNQLDVFVLMLTHVSFTIIFRLNQEGADISAG